MKSSASFERSAEQIEYLKIMTSYLQCMIGSSAEEANAAKIIAEKLRPFTYYVDQFRQLDDQIKIRPDSNEIVTKIRAYQSDPSLLEQAFAEFSAHPVLINAYSASKHFQKLKDNKDKKKYLLLMMLSEQFVSRVKIVAVEFFFSEALKLLNEPKKSTTTTNHLVSEGIKCYAAFHNEPESHDMAYKISANTVDVTRKYKGLLLNMLKTEFSFELLQVNQLSDISSIIDSAIETYESNLFSDRKTKTKINIDEIKHDHIFYVRKLWINYLNKHDCLKSFRQDVLEGFHAIDASEFDALPDLSVNVKELLKSINSLPVLFESRIQSNSSDSRLASQQRNDKSKSSILSPLLFESRIQSNSSDSRLASQQRNDKSKSSILSPRWILGGALITVALTVLGVGIASALIGTGVLAPVGAVVLAATATILAKTAVGAAILLGAASVVGAILGVVTKAVRDCMRGSQLKPMLEWANEPKAEQSVSNTKSSSARCSLVMPPNSEIVPPKTPIVPEAVPPRELTEAQQERVSMLMERCPIGAFGAPSQSHVPEIEPLSHKG